MKEKTIDLDAITKRVVIILKVKMILEQLKAGASIYEGEGPKIRMPQMGFPQKSGPFFHRYLTL